jgi:outer membrane lipase/esterase
MTIKKRILPALLFSLFAASAPAQAAQFTNVIVFGDSLSDVGYYRGFIVSLGLPTSISSQMGRFTTNPGPVWSELISQFYGINPAPSNAGGSVYAQGGARVALTPGITPTGQAERPVATQITEYLSTHGNAADPNALFTMWAGANDFFVNNSLLTSGAINATQFQSNILGAATAEVQQTARLFQAGAQHVMVVLNFDPTMTPGVATLDATTRAGLQQLAAGYNTTLLTGFASAGLRVIPVDLFSLFNEIRANPTSFGFTNITGFACGSFPPITTTPQALFCVVGQNVATNAQNTFLFADPSGHLTTAGNRVVAQFAESLIEGPYNYAQLAEAPLRSRQLHVQGVADGIANGQAAEVGRWTIFAAGGGGKFDVETTPGTTGVSNKNEAYTVGVTMRTSPGVTLGGAFGQTRVRGSFASDLGGYRARENTWSLFGSLVAGGFYGSAIVSLADIKYTDINRNIVLGAQTRTATANAGGTNTSAFLNAGYDFALGRFLVGPTVSLTSQSVDVNGFDEAGAGSANLRILDQRRRSEVWSAGARASFDLGGWTPWLRVTADKERRDDGRNVTAIPLTVVATNSQYDVPVFGGDTSWVTYMLGIRGSFTRNAGVGVTYYKVAGRSGTSEEGVTATISVRF